MLAVLFIAGCSTMGSSDKGVAASNAANNVSNDMPTSKVKNYKIQKGDTLWKIAKKEDVSMACIEKANNMKDKAKIYTGEVLVIPAKEDC